VTKAVVGDVKNVLTAINQELEQQNHSEWMSHIMEYQEKFPLSYPPEGLSGPWLVSEIYNKTKGEALIVTDVGQHQMWAAQFYRYTKPRTFISSGGLGTMGYGLGAAIGVQMANPAKQTINIAGDGCFRMNMNEVATAVRQKLPLIEIIVNNHVLGMVRQWQNLFYEERYSSTILDDAVDFVKVAEGLGATAYRATTREEFQEAFDKALESKTPVVIDCMIDRDQKVWPMVAPGAAISEAFTDIDLETRK
jgi:acetolactate synthase-1/2/3 large subunit